MKRFGLLALSFLALQALAETPRRLITVGGHVSETVCALGACERIVATDSSSLYPARLTKLPQVGYARALNAEGLLAQKADVIITTTSAGPDSVLERVKSTGISLQKVDGGITVDAAKARIMALGGILNKKAEADGLVTELQTDLLTLQDQRLKITAPQKILFIYARGSKVLQVAGRNTAAATMIELAGGINAFSGFSDYRALTPESVVAAAPHVILMTQDGLDSLGGPDAVWSLPGLAMTPAFRKKRLVVMNDLFLLGMGPRLGKAALSLMNELYAGDGNRIAPLSRK
jgi:iron complex transport system substrate-binding protein